MTLSKIAKLAHVSVSTVSKAFSMSNDINEQTREIVFDIAKQHGCFRKYYNAKYPKHVVAVICPEFKSRYYAKVLSLIQEKFFEANCEISAASTNFSKETEEALFEYYSKYAAVDAIIVIGGSAALDNSINVPVGTIDSPNLKDTNITIKLNNKKALSDALDYFIDNKAETIGFIGELKTKGKKDLFESLLIEKTGNCDSKYIAVSGERFEEGGYDAMKTLIENETVPRAVVCAYAQMAVGAISCAVEHNLRVPEDVAVISLNDILNTQYLNPPLASIDTNIEKAIDKMVEVLVSAINGKPTKEEIEIEGTFFLRKSAKII